MAHHAYLYAGERSKGLRAARSFAESSLGLRGAANPDYIVFEYGLFSIENARRVFVLAQQSSVAGGPRCIVLAVGRLFHEAQNALLKLFEEPIEGTTLVLIVPSEGIVLPTLRSRLLALPSNEIDSNSGEEGIASTFLSASAPERTKLVAQLLARSKSDKDTEKQEARLQAAEILDALTRAAYDARQKGDDTKETALLLRDLTRFAPLMHERSAPLKLIFEHLLLVMPERLGK